MKQRYVLLFIGYNVEKLIKKTVLQLGRDIEMKLQLEVILATLKDRNTYQQILTRGRSKGGLWGLETPFQSVLF